MFHLHTFSIELNVGEVDAGSPLRIETAFFFLVELKHIDCQISRACLICCYLLSFSFVQSFIELRKKIVYCDYINLFYFQTEYS